MQIKNNTNTTHPPREFLKWGREKTHVDNAGRPATTRNGEDWDINNLPNFPVNRSDGLYNSDGLTFEGPTFPEILWLLFQPSSWQESNYSGNKANNRLTKWVDHDRQQWQAERSIQQSSRMCGLTLDHWVQDYVGLIVVSALQDETSLSKVCMSMVHDLPNWRYIQLNLSHPYLLCCQIRSDFGAQCVMRVGMPREAPE